MELIGKLKKINDVVDRGDFKSRKIWITTEDNPQYPQTIEVELQKDKVDMFNRISIGAPVTLHINLRGREWTPKDGDTKVFNTLVCWRVEAGHVAKPIDTSMELPETTDDNGEQLPF
jgi:hypothetical protein